MSNKCSYLIHYASPYYDPVKAHEYYMKNRELVGDKNSSDSSTTSTKTKRKGTLNEQGKAAKDYVRQQIYAERDTNLANEDASKKSQLEQIKNEKQSLLSKNAEEREAEISNYSNQMNSKIEMLSKRLKNMSSSGKSSQSQTILNEIAKLRNANKSKREELNAAYSAKSASINSEYSSKGQSVSQQSSAAKTKIRQDAKDKYNSELDKIYSDSSMLKPSRSKKS